MLLFGMLFAVELYCYDALIDNIQPGKRGVWLHNSRGKEQVMKDVVDWYELRMWIPIIKQYLCDLYGEDVSQIIMDYYDNIECKTE